MSAALARPPAGPAHPGPLPRVLPRAGGDLLGVHLSVLLTAGLGIAFRSRAPDRTPVALVARGARTDTPGRAARAARTASRSGRSPTPPPPRRSAPGDVALVVVPERLPASSTATTPSARMRARRGCGWTRRCSAPPAAPTPFAASERTVREAGAPLHRLRGARAARHEPHGQRHLGDRLRDRGRPSASTCSSASSRRRCRGRSILASFVLSRLTFLVHRGRAAARLRRAGLRRAAARLARSCSLALCLLSALAFSSLGLLLSPRAAHRRRRVGADEPRDAADVDLLRGLLLVLPISRRRSSRSSRRFRSRR